MKLHLPILYTANHITYTYAPQSQIDTYQHTHMSTITHTLHHTHSHPLAHTLTHTHTHTHTQSLTYPHTHVHIQTHIHTYHIEFVDDF